MVEERINYTASNLWTAVNIRAFVIVLSEGRNCKATEAAGRVDIVVFSRLAGVYVGLSEKALEIRIDGEWNRHLMLYV